MDFYLASYKFGNHKKEFLNLISKTNKKTAFIPNAGDAYPKKKNEERTAKTLEELKEVGLDPEIIDLKQYFGKEKALEKKLKTKEVIWVKGGNTFVLRKAMNLSGFDKIFKKLLNKKKMLYAGYSAGIVVLAPSLKSTEIVDAKNAIPYKNKKILWEGLNYLPYLPLPHYASNHPESKKINKTIKYCIKEKIPFKTLKDNEVIVIKEGREIILK